MGTPTTPQVGIGYRSENIAPFFYTGEIGEFEETEVVAVFSEQIAASAYDLGVTIKKNTVAQAISAAVRQVDLLTVYYTIAAADGDDSLTWEYSNAVGDITDLPGNPLEDVTAQAVVNSICTRWYFNYNHNSAHLLTI